VDGDELPFVPKVTGSVGVNYRFPVMAGWTGYAGGTVNYTGERVSDFSQRAAKDVPSYTTINLSAGVENANWRLAFYAKNLNDKRGITFLKSETLAPGGSPFGAGIIAPRTLGADLSYRF
jgi:iron complex outermembrane receptor protein